MIPTERLKEIAEGLEALVSDLGRWDRLQFGGTKQHRDGADEVKATIKSRLEPILADLLALRAAPAGNELVERLKDAAIALEEAQAFLANAENVDDANFGQQTRYANGAVAIRQALSAPATIRLQALEEAATKFSITGPYHYRDDLHPSLRIDGNDRLVATVWITAGEEEARADAEIIIRALAQEKPNG